ncbi:VC0807 family protein [Thiohalophilus sp.]|uniref:VC0807 family protein n=1 Tax=Thiohalophilus sp. TaxID=3028392 RepID=UPI002ACE97D6|nr:VC0807 family protein [Thiohalophilus sp.]MDZ7805345.1 VC0807 family protein [Thiohalophilus sp.]
MDNESTTSVQSTPTHKPRPMIDLLVSILIPSVILMKFSNPEHLGPSGALVIALAFPLGWGTFELFKYRKFNFIALLGLISVLLTGGIGLLELGPKWLAVKEAAIPGLIGLVILISAYTPYPLIRTLLFNPRVMNIEKIETKLHELGTQHLFDTRLNNATYLLSSTFLFSAVMNYLLVTWIVISPAGTPAFNEELGQMTLLSYPVIAIPSTVMMMAILYYLWRTIRTLTGYTLEEIITMPGD